MSVYVCWLLEAETAALLLSYSGDFGRRALKYDLFGECAFGAPSTTLVTIHNPRYTIFQWQITLVQIQIFVSIQVY